MTLTHRLALAAMFAGPAAFAQTSSTGSAGTATPRTTTATEASKSPAAMSPSAVLSILHQVNQDEIRLGKLAQSKATSDKVKGFAKDMVDDHTALDKKISEFVQKDGKGKVTLSSSQIPAHKRQEMKSMIDEAERKLKSASPGAAFDREYMAAMEKGHDAVLSDLDAALPALNGQDKIHDLVSDARDKVKDHRDHARDILKDLGTSAATGGSGMQGTSSSTAGSQDTTPQSVGGGAVGATTGTRDTHSAPTPAPSGSTTTPSTTPSTSGGTGR